MLWSPRPTAGPTWPAIPGPTPPSWLDSCSVPSPRPETTQIHSEDPDATRKFFGDLLGWTYPDQGAVPGYTFVDTGVPGALYTAISPLQGGADLVTFFIAVDDIDGAVSRARELGGRVVQEPQHVPGVAFALIADPQGHVVGLTQQG